MTTLLYRVLYDLFIVSMFILSAFVSSYLLHEITKEPHV